jgi:hypothetical protein
MDQAGALVAGYGLVVADYPETAPVVAWMFSQRLARHSLARRERFPA